MLVLFVPILLYASAHPSKNFRDFPFSAGFVPLARRDRTIFIHSASEYRRVWDRTAVIMLTYFLQSKWVLVPSVLLNYGKTLLRTFDDTYFSMEYWYGEIQKLRGF